MRRFGDVPVSDRQHAVGMDLLDRIGLDHPVVQAGMGGGVTGAALAGAVSAAGALGTIGITPPPHFRSQLAGACERAAGRPVAANLLVPFTRADHVRACVEERAALVVFHGGIGRRWFLPLREAAIPVFCTVGSIAQTRAALAAGVDGLVVQGVEAGGHLMGEESLSDLLPQVRGLGAFPILAAGGIADARDVRTVLDAGADAAVSGTRFLLTHESRAHASYKQRVQAATRTVRTMLFGFGWPLAHRVVPNAATERWTAPDGALPGWLGRTERLTAPLSRVLPLRAGNVMLSRQRVGMPLFGPSLPVAGMPEDVVDRTALYAGETALRIDDLIPASEAVARLAGGGPASSPR
jgi:NAD(P)H-dependent flavin oxidoreductase YrpB (nitropropane dioxygenase family)